MTGSIVRDRRERDCSVHGTFEGLRSRRGTPDEPWVLTRTPPVCSVMRPYVQAMVADGA